ncbi:MAG: ABC transporter permease subunit, partial [Eubacteriales bacterium]
MESRLSNLQTQLTKINTESASATPEQKAQLNVDAANLQSQVDSINTSITMDVYLYTDFYIAQAIQNVATYKTEANNLNAIPAAALTQAQTDEKVLLASLIPGMEKVITNKDFAVYTELINQQLNANTDISQTDKAIQLEQNNLRLQYNVTNEDKNNSVRHNDFATVTADDIISNIGLARKSLAYNLDFSANQNAPVPLTNERRTQITDNITVFIKQLDVGATSTDNFMHMGYILTVGTFMFELLLLMLAGGAISQEISTGSIKSLIISPTKRWKIYFAKLMSLATVGAIAAVLCFLIGILANGVFFGFNSGSPYIYISSGTAMIMNFYVFSLAKLFVGLIPVAFYMVLALVLSTVTRNTAASVGISIGVLFGGTAAYPVLANILTGEWMKFLPFPNFDFVSKIFTFDPSISAIPGVSTTIAFSAVYVVITVCLIFYIGLDSFNRRDIK